MADHFAAGFDKVKASIKKCNKKHTFKIAIKDILMHLILQPLCIIDMP